MKNLLFKYIYASKQSQQEVKNQLLDKLKDPNNLEFLIRNVDNFVFRRIVEDLGLPLSVIEKREQLEGDVINNYQTSSLDSVQNAVCDMLFHLSPSLVVLKIKTMKERAETCDEFNLVYGKYESFFNKIVEFLSLNNQVSSQEIGAFLQEIQAYRYIFDNVEKQVFDVVEELYSKAEKDFVLDLSENVKQTGEKIFNGVKSEDIESESGEKVCYYKIQNQTENQRKIYMLSRSTNVFPYMTEEGAKEKYQEEVSKFDYFSYSVFDECHTRSFAGRYKIRFGFFDLPKKTDIVSSSVYDGQTNQFTIEKGKTVVPQQLMALPEFINQTGQSYNEIVLTNPEQIIPSVVITASETPTEEEIKVAKAFNIPLVFIDRGCYEQSEQQQRKAGFIDYKALLKTPLGKPEDEQILS